jgi:hypothetical protein
VALDLIDELEAILAVLESAKIEYAVCGGLAVAIHGHPRATKDIDLLVEAADVSAVLALVKPLGYDEPSRKMVFRAGKPDEHHMHRISKLDPADPSRLVSLDLLIVVPVHQATWDTRVRFRWQRGVLSIVSRDGLVNMKRMSARLQDLADIAALEGSSDEDQE